MERRWLWAFLVVSAASLAIPGAAQDPCADIQAAINSDPPSSVRPSELKACLDSFPYDSAIAAATAKTLLTVLQAYVFNVPGLVAAIQKIRTTTFPTERAFHDALRSAFVAVGDVHLYYASSCFHSPYSATLQLPLTVVRSGSSAAVIVSPWVEQLSPDARLWSWVNISKFSGATVFKINGVSAKVALAKHYASPPDYSEHDPAVRFARASARLSWLGTGSQVFGYFDPGTFSSRSGSLPTTDFLTLQLRRKGKGRKETVRVPWAVQYFSSSNTFGSNASQYYTNNCALPDASEMAARLARLRRGLGQVPPELDAGVGAAGEEGKVEMAQVHQESQQRVLRMRQLNRRLAVSAMDASSQALPPLCDSSLQGYLLNDNLTGVLVIPTLTMTAPTLNNDLSDCINTLKGLGATKLLIDTRGNVGGRIPAGFQLVNSLFPSFTNPSPAYVFSGSVYVQRLVLASLQAFNSSYCANSICRFSYGSWLTGDVRPISRAEDFYFPVADVMQFQSPLRKPGSSATVSQPFRQKFFPGTLPDDPQPFDTSSILLLTDGSCVSICAVVAYILKDLGVRIAFIGGATPSVVQSVSNPGGAVLNFEGELIPQDLVPLGRSGDDDQPQPFVRQATLTFTLRAAVTAAGPVDKSQALEFLPLPPDFYVYNTGDISVNLQAAWPVASEFLAT